ncbi:MAG: DapH/DapD/GlmU-related protein [Actinomycetota bacterium]|nr:DapH/DapD/GlmU-related protein [Actinomycetota bacterium]
MNDENKEVQNISNDKDGDSKKINEEVRSKTLTKSGGSKFKKYCDFFVGKRGFFAFLKYEIITCLFASCPGAVGIYLRSIFYKLLLKKVGKGVSFGKNIVLRHPNKIIIGNNVVIDDNCMLDAKGSTNKGIIIEDGVFLGRNTILSCKDGDIILRENVNLGFNCDIFSGRKIEIGKDTMIAAYVYFVAGNYVYDSADKPATEMDTVCKGIYVGENCWFGAKALIFDGVNIGRNSIIGGAAVVNEDIPEYSIAVGMPAKVVKSRKA